MRRALVLAMLAFVAPAALSGQTLVVLHIRAVLVDATGTATPVARHALLISDNPPTREPRRIVTRADGTADVRLRPGSYTVESDQPVAFQGQGFYWTQTVTVAADGGSLELTAANAKTETLQPGAANGTPPATDPWLALRPWLDSVVELWTPTAHATGFVVSADGLIATNQKAVGNATSVEVQLSRTVKVAGTVVESDSERGVAVVRIDPAVLSSVKPVPTGCASAATPPAVERGKEIFTLAAPLRQQKGIAFGTVNRVETRAIASDLIVATGGLGGPVFNAAGDLVGITSLPDGRDERSEESRIVRVADACAVIAAAIAKSTGAPAPDSPRLPVEPTTATPSVDSLKEAAKRRAGSLKPYQLTSFDFDVGFMTPVLTYHAQSQPNQDFSNWSEYVSDNPPVLFIRVTPRMAENFWAKVARGAAQTQGMALPPIKRMRSGFLRLHAFCGAAEVTPIHPFKLERRVAEAEAIFEGLYVFDPAALGPACGTVKLVLHSEKEPGKADTRVVDPVILRQIWRDFGLETSG